MDIDTIISLIARQGSTNTAVIVNCQVGLGRSTTGTVIASLIYKWLGAGAAVTPGVQQSHSLDDGDSDEGAESRMSAGAGSMAGKWERPMRSDSYLSASSFSAKKAQHVNYTIINTLMRVVKNGVFSRAAYTRVQVWQARPSWTG